MSKQATYEDPAKARMMGSQSMQYIKGWVYLMATMLGAMVLGFIGVFYAISIWGGMIGLFVGGSEVAGVAGGLATYYWMAIMIPVSAGLNLSAQVCESEQDWWGLWLVNDIPLSAIPMEEEQRLMPVRIPFGEFGKNPTTSTEQVAEGESGLAITEEIRVNCPNPKCDFHNTKFRVDYGEITHKLPYLQFKTFAYVATPNQGSAPFEKAVIIAPCEIDSLRQIRDLIFFKGFPVMARTVFVSLTRVFEMDETIPIFNAPCYVVTHSSWHVKLAQQLAGFTPAFMVPNLERVVETYNLWAVAEALKLTQQLKTAHARIQSLEGSQVDYDKAVEATAANIRKQEDLMDMFPRKMRTGLLKPKVLALIAATIIGVAIAVYLLTTYVFK